MRVTVEFQRGNPSASIKSFQTTAELAAMLTSTLHTMAKALSIRVNCALLIIGGGLIRPVRACYS